MADPSDKPPPTDKPPATAAVTQLQPPPTVEVTLLQPHNHAGQHYKPGEKINVTEAERLWLIARGIVAPLPQIPPSPVK